MKEKIRIGFVGCGQFAKHFVPLFKAHPACEYVALCDKFRDRAENFMEKVEDAKGTVLVDFFATWCGPCKMIAPTIEQISKEYEGKAAVYKLDVDEAQEIAMKYGIMSIPTLVFFKDGQVLERIRGAVSKLELADAMERNL